MNESRYMETPVGKIPMDWRASRLVDVADYLNGYAFGPDDWKAKGLPIIRIQNLNNVDAEFNYFDGEIDERYIIRKGDLLFSWSASIGVYLWNRQKAVLNQHIFKVTPRDKVDKTYLYYALFLAIEQLKKRVHGSTMKHFKRGELKRTFIALPPFKEQQEIARVLSCVDDAIRQVELAIAKTERLKKGLIHKLLSEGVGHKEFKETKIGKIPKKWEVVKLKSIVKKKSDIVAGPFGSNLKVCDYTSYGVPIIRLQNIERNQFINKGIKYTSQKKAEELSYHSYQPGDIILAKLGDPIGKTCIVPSFMKAGIVVADVVRIRPSPEKAVTLFLEYVLNSSMCFYQLRKQTIGSTRPRVNISQVRNLRIPLPPLDEQQRIADILSTIDHKFGLEKRRKGKLERIKKGLMNDLLAGRKRVKVAM